jgi:hypothetical protein
VVLATGLMRLCELRRIAGGAIKIGVLLKH